MTERQKAPRHMPHKRDQADEQIRDRQEIMDEAEQRQRAGDRPADEQEAYFDQSAVDDLGQITATDVSMGELEAGVNDDLPNDPDELELLVERELRAEETDQPFEAVEEGFTYVPPIDPPVRVEDSWDDAEIASGFGTSALDEPYDQDGHAGFLPGDDEVSARVRAALRADSTTTGYADKVTIITRGATVVLRGEVDDLEDSDNLVAVAGYVNGIAEVIDQLQVRHM